MESAQHSRPLWIGLTACALLAPLTMSILQAFSVEGVIVGPILVFLVGSMISGAVTVFVAAPLVLVLRHIGALNSFLVIILGTLAGALALGLFAYSDSQYPMMRDQELARWITRQAVLKAMKLGAIYGFLSSAALCVGAGITIRSSRARFAASAKSR